METESTESTHFLILDRSFSCSIAPEFYGNICLRLIQELKRQPGKLLFPSQLYTPFPTAGLGLVCQDMYIIRDHLKKISTMARDEADRANAILTAQKAQEVQQQMDLIQSFRRMNPHLASCGEACASHLNSLVRIRSEYYIILPLTFRINDLPLDILIEIMRFASSPSTATRSKSAAAMRLSHVCQKWRDITLSDSNLWNPVQFIWPKNLQWELLLLARAGDAGVDVCIGDPTLWMPIPTLILKPLLDDILARVQRLRRLMVFAMDQEAISCVLNSLAQSPFDASKSLESLSLRLSNLRNLPVPRMDGPLLGEVTAKFLRHITLHGISLDWRANIQLLPTLTTLELRSIALGNAPTSSQFRAILRQTTSLSKLVLDGSGPTYPPNIPLLSPVLLSSLKTLVIGGCSGSYFQYLLTHFTSPNVLHLTVTHQLQCDLDVALYGLTHSNPMPHVRILTLKAFSINESLSTYQKEMLADWVRMMPWLAFIRLINTMPCILDAILPDNEEIVDGTPVAIAEELKYLDWQTTKKVGEFDDVKRFLAFRKSLGMPLKKLWIGPHMVSLLREQDIAVCLESLQVNEATAISDEFTQEEEELMMFMET